VSGVAPIEAGVGAGAEYASWHVRRAATNDAAAVAAAVGELLLELGGASPPLPAMEAAVLALLGDPESGAVFVAQSVPAGTEFDGAKGGAGGGGGTAGVSTGGAIAASLLGVLGASWQSAIHIPGRYALIQDLWVHPTWRGAGVGAGLLAALFDSAVERGIARVEVGLPRAQFAGLAVTEAFYCANGFAPLGVRMRRRLS
jgi:GNAT superfamily N-acetyltransferase